MMKRVVSYAIFLIFINMNLDSFNKSNNILFHQDFIFHGRPSI